MIKSIILSVTLFFFSCTTTSIHLQNALINGPSSKSTIKIAESAIPQKTIVRSFISLNTDDEIGINTGAHTKVNEDGIYELEPYRDIIIEPSGANNFDFEGENLTWNLPQSHFNLEVEFTRKHLAYLFGINYSRTNGTNFLGGNAGIGYFKNSHKWAWRMDFNLHFSAIDYDVNYVVKTKQLFYGSDPFPQYLASVSQYRKSGKEIYWRP